MQTKASPAILRGFNRRNGHRGRIELLQARSDSSPLLVGGHKWFGSSSADGDADGYVRKPKGRRHVLSSKLFSNPRLDCDRRDVAGFSGFRVKCPARPRLMATAIP